MLGNKAIYAIGVMGTAIPDVAEAPLSRRAMYSVTRVVWTGRNEDDFLLGCRFVRVGRDDVEGDGSEALSRREVRLQKERLNSSKASSVCGVVRFLQRTLLGTVLLWRLCHSRQESRVSYGSRFP